MKKRVQGKREVMVSLTIVQHYLSEKGCEGTAGEVKKEQLSQGTGKTGSVVKGGGLAHV